MIWPAEAIDHFIDPITASGYKIRVYHPGDESSFLRLMVAGEFDRWDDEKLQFNMGKIVPGGWFFAVETRSNDIVGTAMCIHNYTGTAPFVGDLGWLACAPVHRGHGLGYSLTAHVTNRFHQAGYANIQLHTEYYRLPAIKTYLRIGYQPVMYSSDMNGLWMEVCDQIDWEFTPEVWPKSAHPYPKFFGKT